MITTVTEDHLRRARAALRISGTRSNCCLVAQALLDLNLGPVVCGIETASIAGKAYNLDEEAKSLVNAFDYGHEITLPAVITLEAVEC